MSWIVTAIIVLVVAVWVLAAFYQRATREVSLVRTGVGGRKVVMDGGTLALPFFHEMSRVNMQTLRLEVSRSGEAALITQDRMRVDVGVEFYVSVIPSEAGVARAAQTLGNRTFHADKLSELIEGKLVDALRSVAARMTMDELHENRGTFVVDVRAGLTESLERNGLELDTVSLTALDQTPFRALDENNAFNAVGMRKLAEVIAKSKKERAEIDADADVSVRQAAMQAAKKKLTIELEEQQAQIVQVQQIETLKAAQIAEVVKRKADSERESARARIQMEHDIRSAEIAKDLALNEAEVARERDLAIANQERQITVARKSQDESKARASADNARADAVRAAEAVTTAREVAEAERRREIALVAAKGRIEEEKANAEATTLRAAATRTEQLAQAEGQRALIGAENETEAHIVAMKVELAKLAALPKVVAEMVKPAEKIDSIRIHHVSGLGSSGAHGAPGAKTAVNQALDSILEMAVQLPALKKIGEDLGISLDAGLAGVGRDVLRPGESGEAGERGGAGGEAKAGGTKGGNPAR